MNLDQLQQLISETFGEEVILGNNPEDTPPSLTLKSEKIREICRFLLTNSKTYFDFLSCLTALDSGAKANTFEVIYHLYSIPYNHKVTLKISVPKENPIIPTVSDIWQTANWHEREAYDLVGVKFEGHQDLRRILLPNDWEGHPLQKEYQHQERYHGIRVAY